MSEPAPAAGSAPDVVRAVLLAHPAGHSLSPVMHDAALAASGIGGRYHAWDVPPERLGDAVERLRADRALLGANVTVPHKVAVLELLDGLTPVARLLGAVNTVLRRRGRLIGDNTDASGFRAALAEAGVAPGGARALVLGAGGAARAVVAALLEEGAEVALSNRTPARALALADALAGLGRVALPSPSELPAQVRGCSLLVNTTSVGMEGGPPGSPLDDGLLPRAGTVVDLVYRPRRTALLEAAEAAGLRVVDGVPMLVHQGARAFEAWTGERAPVAAMRSAVESALAG